MIQPKTEGKSSINDFWINQLKFQAACLLKILLWWGYWSENFKIEQSCRNLGTSYKKFSKIV